VGASIRQPRFKSVASDDLRAPRRKLASEKPRIVTDDDELLRSRRRILVEILRNRVRRQFDVGERERIADDAAPT